eukprot:TRINITY_DN960_c1_g1_i1.p1 TRINITY_DN960_c1_g1~~TRINITY_DN960_c1_g1_i1.p1  ORF type:complete len:1957 (+),score=491.08 TRINITY_DN960_c1_g1_i1:36-5906(+)
MEVPPLQVRSVGHTSSVSPVSFYGRWSSVSPASSQAQQHLNHLQDKVRRLSGNVDKVMERRSPATAAPSLREPSSAASSTIVMSPASRFEKEPLRSHSIQSSPPRRHRPGNNKPKAQEFLEAEVKALRKELHNEKAKGRNGNNGNYNTELLKELKAKQQQHEERLSYLFSMRNSGGGSGATTRSLKDTSDIFSSETNSRGEVSSSQAQGFNTIEAAHRRGLLAVTESSRGDLHSQLSEKQKLLEKLLHERDESHRLKHQREQQHLNELHAKQEESERRHRQHWERSLQEKEQQQHEWENILQRKEKEVADQKERLERDLRERERVREHSTEQQQREWDRALQEKEEETARIQREAERQREIDEKGWREALRSKEEEAQRQQEEWTRVLRDKEDEAARQQEKIERDLLKREQEREREIEERQRRWETALQAKEEEAALAQQQKEKVEREAERREQEIARDRHEAAQRLKQQQEEMTRNTRLHTTSVEEPSAAPYQDTQYSTSETKPNRDAENEHEEEEEEEEEKKQPGWNKTEARDTQLNGSNKPRLNRDDDTLENKWEQPAHNRDEPETVEEAWGQPVQATHAHHTQEEEYREEWANKHNEIEWEKQKAIQEEEQAWESEQRRERDRRWAQREQERALLEEEEGWTQRGEHFETDSNKGEDVVQMSATHSQSDDTQETEDAGTTHAHAQGLEVIQTARLEEEVPIQRSPRSHLQVDHAREQHSQAEHERLLREHSDRERQEIVMKERERVKLKKEMLQRRGSQRRVFQRPAPPSEEPHVTTQRATPDGATPKPREQRRGKHDFARGTIQSEARSVTPTSSPRRQSAPPSRVVNHFNARAKQARQRSASRGSISRDRASNSSSRRRASSSSPPPSSSGRASSPPLSGAEKKGKLREFRKGLGKNGGALFNFEALEDGYDREKAEKALQESKKLDEYNKEVMERVAKQDKDGKHGDWAPSGSGTVYPWRSPHRHRTNSYRTEFYQMDAQNLPRVPKKRVRRGSRDRTKDGRSPDKEDKDIYSDAGSQGDSSDEEDSYANIRRRHSTPSQERTRSGSVVLNFNFNQDALNATGGVSPTTTPDPSPATDTPLPLKVTSSGRQLYWTTVSPEEQSLKAPRGERNNNSSSNGNRRRRHGTTASSTTTPVARDSLSPVPTPMGDVPQPMQSSSGPPTTAKVTAYKRTSSTSPYPFVPPPSSDEEGTPTRKHRHRDEASPSRHRDHEVSPPRHSSVEREVQTTESPRRSFGVQVNEEHPRPLTAPDPVQPLGSTFITDDGANVVVAIDADELQVFSEESGVEVSGDAQSETASWEMPQPFPDPRKIEDPFVEKYVKKKTLKRPDPPKATLTLATELLAKMPVGLSDAPLKSAPEPVVGSLLGMSFNRVSREDDGQDVEDAFIDHIIKSKQGEGHLSNGRVSEPYTGVKRVPTGSDLRKLGELHAEAMRQGGDHPSGSLRDALERQAKIRAAGGVFVCKDCRKDPTMHGYCTETGKPHEKQCPKCKNPPTAFKYCPVTGKHHGMVIERRRSNEGPARPSSDGGAAESSDHQYSEVHSDASASEKGAPTHTDDSRSDANGEDLVAQLDATFDANGTMNTNTNTNTNNTPLVVPSDAAGHPPPVVYPDPTDGAEISIRISPDGRHMQYAVLGENRPPFTRLATSKHGRALHMPEINKQVDLPAEPSARSEVFSKVSNLCTVANVSFIAPVVYTTSQGAVVELYKEGTAMGCSVNNVQKPSFKTVRLAGSTISFPELSQDVELPAHMKEKVTFLMEKCSGVALLTGVPRPKRSALTDTALESGYTGVWAVRHSTKGGQGTPPRWVLVTRDGQYVAWYAKPGDAEPRQKCSVRGVIAVKYETKEHGRYSFTLIRKDKDITFTTNDRKGLLALMVTITQHAKKRPFTAGTVLWKLARRISLKPDDPLPLTEMSHRSGSTPQTASIFSQDTARASRGRGRGRGLALPAALL